MLKQERSSSIQILIVEDSAADTQLMLRALRKAEMPADFLQVSNDQDMRQALRTAKWDLILSDYFMPGFGAVPALKVLEEEGVELPLIVVSGAIGEETAVEVMRLGATDYVMKSNLTRLPLVIDRELKEAKQREAGRLASRELKRSQEFTARVLESSQDCIKVLDLEGHLLSINKAGMSLLDICDAGAVIGTYWPDFWKESSHDSAPSALAAARAGSSGKFVGFCPTMSNKPKWWDVMITPILDADGQPERLLAVSRDVTEQRLIQEELSRSREQLEFALEKATTASELKSTFLANMSHEIRTPLGVMLGYVDLLDTANPSEEERKHYLSTVRRNGKLLARLIDDVLDLSKVESGRLEVESIKFSLGSVLEDLIKTFEAKAHEKDIALKLHLRTALPEVIESDPTRVRQILMNIVGNAVKFTEKGSVDLWLETTSNSIEIEVQDTGVGVPYHKRSKLFQQFSQADETMSRRFGGSGLGLALSKSLAQRLGGDVLLKESKPDEGSIFLIRLPLRPPDLQEQQAPFAPEPLETENFGAEPQSKGEFKDLKILVVEDLPDNRDLVCRYLKKAGVAEVVCAEDGASGVEAALADDFDLILMDIQMPGMDGFQAVAELKDQQYPTPVVALTAHAMAGDRERCLTAGFDDYLSKPVNRTDLLRTIKKNALTSNKEQSIQGVGSRPQEKKHHTNHG